MPTSLFFLRLSFVLLLLTSAATLRAQDTRPTIQNRIENTRIAYITRELNLTPEQAQRFWPLYNEYVAKRRELRRTHDQLRSSASPTLSEDQARDNLKQLIVSSKNELNLTEDYFGKFQKAISARQVAQLYKAEREFGLVMMRELKTQRQAGRSGARPLRPATLPGN